MSDLPIVRMEDVGTTNGAQTTTITTTQIPKPFEYGTSVSGEKKSGCTDYFSTTGMDILQKMKEEEEDQQEVENEGERRRGREQKINSTDTTHCTSTMNGSILLGGGCKKQEETRSTNADRFVTDQGDGDFTSSTVPYSLLAIITGDCQILGGGSMSPARVGTTTGGGGAGTIPLLSGVFAPPQQTPLNDTSNNNSSSPVQFVSSTSSSVSTSYNNDPPLMLDDETALLLTSASSFTSSGHNGLGFIDLQGGVSSPTASGADI